MNLSGRLLPYWLLLSKYNFKSPALLTVSGDLKLEKKKLNKKTFSHFKYNTLFPKKQIFDKNIAKSERDCYLGIGP